MRILALALSTLAALGAALLSPACSAQQVAEFELSPPPAHTASASPEHLSFTLAVRDANISGARIYLAPSAKPHPARRTWSYVGMISFFPSGTYEHAMFELPLHGALHGKQKMIAEPIAHDQTAPSALEIVAASIGNPEK